MPQPDPTALGNPIENSVFTVLGLAADWTAAAIVPVRSWVVLFNVARTRCRV